MNIIVNDSPYDFASPLTLHTLLARLEQSATGCALAVNQVIVPRPEWTAHLLAEGDEVVIFQAIAGG
ncbi:sulfur carrier protein ThiS [Rahnella sp. SAP-1]|jgi:sulfur carrier protein|uniref:Sulfur carrier protein ThiS n=1 Tax=Rouxiella aceris TaxID=2703884 RepID=A0A848MSW8_9GAMM|nr:sulfur carrier protein ThiS [Rouxiella aceris]NMP29902.1 sulfur carrier protein ThiS [Rouxiella aceris]